MSYKWPEWDSGEIGIKNTYLKILKLENEKIVVGAGYIE